MSYNFKKGKKILVPAITFSATAASVLYSGLEPKFVDINPNNLTLDFEDLKRKYSKDCVALICVHMGGHPCEMEKILPWAKKKKLLVKKILKILLLVIMDIKIDMVIFMNDP